MRRLVVLGFLLVAMLDAKKAKVTFPFENITKLVSAAYGCGLIDGVARASQDVPQAVAKLQALRAESHCEDVDEFLRLTGEKMKEPKQ